MLNADWLLSKKGNFANFSYELKHCNSQRVYETEFMKVLVDANWVENQKIIKRFCFYPWFLYSISVVYYFSYNLPNDYKE